MTNCNMTIGQNDHGRRADRILRKAFKDFSLSFIHRLIRKKQVLINNLPAKIDSRLQEGDVLSIKGLVTLPEMPETDKKTERGINLPPPDVLYENSDLLILNKPSGIDVHGKESLETIVQAYLYDKLPPSLSFKPGPLHRLDKPTSGIIAFSKSLDGARCFSHALRCGKIKKYYIALMDGLIEKKEVWEDTLFRDKTAKKTYLSAEETEEGQKAVMKIQPLAVSFESNSPYTLAFIELETGRTHQIRAQGTIHNHPLSGDKKYGGSFLQGGFFLHAWMLTVPSNLAPDLPLLMTAPLPLNRKSMLVSIFGGKIQKLYEDNPKLDDLQGIFL